MDFLIWLGQQFVTLWDESIVVHEIAKVHDLALRINLDSLCSRCSA